MDIRQLAYVVAVVDNGGFTRAAAAMNVAQPSLSQSVRALERELGIELFDRGAGSRRAPRLTAAGEALLGPARSAVRDLESARVAVAEVLSVQRGHLDLVCLPTLAAAPVAELIGGFRSRFPGITVRLAEPDDVDSVVQMVANGVAEVGFTELDSVERLNRHDLGVHELASQDYVAVVPPTMDLAGDRVELADLVAAPLITTPVGTSTRRLTDEAFAAAGRVPMIAVETDHREAITALVRSGAGYSLLPRPVAEHIARRDARVVELAVPITRRVAMVWRAAPLSPAAASLRAMVAG